MIRCREMAAGMPRRLHPQYDRGLSTLLHDQLHWLNVPERVEYKLTVMVRRCLENKAPRYLIERCTPVADIDVQPTCTV